MFYNMFSVHGFTCSIQTRKQIDAMLYCFVAAIYLYMKSGYFEGVYHV